MADKRHYLLLFLLCICKVDSDVLCESGFCENYNEDPGCTRPAGQCTINNATHSGLWLPSPTVCNCCNFCLPFIVLGDHCSVGGPGTGTTVGRCGHGLTCVSNSDGDHLCQRMTTACHTAQDSYDARHERGETGALEERPQCDGKGNYAAFSCVPTQSCFCQSDEGERIFGEALYTGAATQQNMQCGCSRMHEKIKKNIESGLRFPVVGPRCTPDGNFHPIQCIDKMCYCVNPMTGVVLEGERRSVDLNRRPLTSLECYDLKLDLYPEQSVGEPPFNITTPCLQNMKEVTDLLESSIDDGFNVDFFSSVASCMPDGSFGRISTTRNRSKICVDERGRKIGDYEAFPGTTQYDEMDCKCAYTAHVIMASEVERPVCCSNGNFRQIQCRRGMCRCVDSDGRQTARENADPTFLSCFNHNWRNC